MTALVQSREGLESYEITGMIAPGGTSAVFSALKRGHPLQTPWRVALKIVWNPELAKKEAENLISLDAIHGVVNLLEYFEVPFHEVEPLLQLTPESFDYTYTRSMMQGTPGSADEKVSVLVLQYLAGSPLISKTEPAPDRDDIDGNCFLIKDIESGLWLKQTLRWELTLREKIGIVSQIAAHIADCHLQGVVHADLKPQNILYNRQTRRVTLLDLGGRGTHGSPGWQGPEHFKVASGELTEHPPGLDVFLLGLFLFRFFENEKTNAFKALAQDCLNLNADDRPDAKTVVAAIRKIERRLFKPKWERLALPTLAGLFLLALAWGIGLTVDRLQPTLNERFGKDDGRAFIERQLALSENHDALKLGTLEQFRALLGHEDAWPALRTNIVLGLARYYRRHNPPFGQTVNLEKIRALWIEQNGLNFMLYGDSWIAQGQWLTPDFFFEGLEFRKPLESGTQDLSFYLVLSDKGKQRTERLPLKRFPWDWEPNGKNMLLIYDAQVFEILSFVSSFTGHSVVNHKTRPASMGGVVYFTDRHRLLETLALVTETQEAGRKRIVLEDTRSDSYIVYGYPIIRKNNAPLAELIEEIAEMTGHRWDDPNSRDLVKPLSYGYSYANFNDHIPWQLVLQDVLKPHGLRFYVRQNRLFIESTDSRHRHLVMQ